MAAGELALVRRLASDEALLDKIVELTITLEAERLLARQAIHALADLQRRHDRLTEQHHHLLNETRALRATQRQEAA